MNTNNQSIKYFILQKTSLPEQDLKKLYLDYVQNYIKPHLKKHGQTNEDCSFKNKHKCFDLIKELFPENWKLICYAFRNYLMCSYFKKIYRNGFKTIKGFDSFIFKSIMNFKYKRLYKIIGVGGNGVVFDSGDKVIKILFVQLDDWQIHTLSFCNKNYPYFPIVYHRINNIIVKEKLILNTEKCQKYTQFVGLEVENSLYKKVLKHRDLYKNKKYTKEEKEILKWLADIFNSNMRINARNVYDVSIYNVGERKDGTVVLFDP